MRSFLSTLCSAVLMSAWRPFELSWWAFDMLLDRHYTRHNFYFDQLTEEESDLFADLADAVVVDDYTRTVYNIDAAQAVWGSMPSWRRARIKRATLEDLAQDCCLACSDSAQANRAVLYALKPYMSAHAHDRLMRKVAHMMYKHRVEGPASARNFALYNLDV